MYQSVYSLRNAAEVCVIASMCTAWQGGVRRAAVSTNACAARTWPLPALTLKTSKSVEVFMGAG